MKNKQAIVLLLVSVFAFCGCSGQEKPVKESEAKHSIAYQLDGGTNSSDNPVKYDSLDLPIRISAPTKAAYDFRGWVSEDLGIAAPLQDLILEKGTTGDISLSAVWSEMIIQYSQEEAAAQQEVAGNMITGGYKAEHEGQYYYYDDIDGKAGLYRIDSKMENKIFEGSLPGYRYKQFADNKLFVVGRSEREKDDGSTIEPSALYAYDLSTHELVELTDEKVNVDGFLINNGWIYFTTLWDKGKNTNGSVYRMRADGSGLTWLTEFDYSRRLLQIAEGRLYLAGNNYSLMSMNLDGSDVQYYDLQHWGSVIYKNNIYYTADKHYETQPGPPADSDGLLNINGKGLFRKSLNGIDDETVELVTGRIINFTIHNNIIYFAGLLNEGDRQQKIYKMDLDGNSLEYIADGVCPNVVGDYLFYDGADKWQNCAYIQISGSRSGFLTEWRYELPYNGTEEYLIGE